MRGAILMRPVAVVALLFGFASCAQPSRPPSGTDCHPTTEAELREIAAGGTPCDWLWVVETELEDLEGLRDHHNPFEGVAVVENDRLHSLGGLGDLSDLTQVGVTDNPVLTEVNASWHGVAEIDIARNSVERITLDVSPHAVDLLALIIADEPVSELAVAGSSRLTKLNLYRLPELSSLDGLAAIETVDELQIADLPLLSADALDAFLARLDPAPAWVEVCGAAGRPPC